MSTMPAEVSADQPARVRVGFRDEVFEGQPGLIGNRAGLELLRRKLDEALAAGECAIAEPGVELAGIRLTSDPDSFGPIAPPRGGWRDLAALLGCAAVVLVVLILAFLAAMALWSRRS